MDERQRNIDTCRLLAEYRQDGTPTFPWWSRLADMLESDAPPTGAVRFHVRIDDGPEQTIDTLTGLYSLACIAAVATLTDLQSADVEIWMPHLVDAGFGPYRYRVQPRESGSGFGKRAADQETRMTVAVIP